MTAKKARISGPGTVEDRSAKGGKLKLQFDPSPDSFVTEARSAKEKLHVTIIPDNGSLKPIEIMADPAVWSFQLKNCRIPKERLADLERLITEEESVHVSLEYMSVQESLPGIGAEG